MTYGERIRRAKARHYKPEADKDYGWVVVIMVLILSLILFAMTSKTYTAETPVVTEVSDPPTRSDTSVSTDVKSLPPKDNLPLSSVLNESGESKQLTSEAPKSTAGKSTRAPTLSSPDCGLTEVLSLAGVASSDHKYANFIFYKESSCSSLAVNAVSGAVGLCQAMPHVHKLPDDYRTDIPTQVTWCNQYAIDRYGGWQNAYHAWLRQGWW